MIELILIFLTILTVLNLAMLVQISSFLIKFADAVSKEPDVEPRPLPTYDPRFSG